MANGSKVWFITGSSKGFGHIWAEAALARGDRVAAFTTLGLYPTSTWTQDGLSKTMATKVAGFGIKVTLVEPTGYTTDWAGPSSVHAGEIPAYDEVRAARAQAWANRTRGNPEA